MFKYDELIIDLKNIQNELNGLILKVENNNINSTLNDFNSLAENILTFQVKIKNENIDESFNEILFNDMTTVVENILNYYESGEKRSLLSILECELTTKVNILCNSLVYKNRVSNISEEDKVKVVEKVNSFPYWYHKIEVPGDITTPGWAPIDKNAYKIPIDLTGKRILDVGAWDGFWSFEALKRGAKEVVAIDDFSDFLGSLDNSDRRAWENFDFCKNTLGYSDEQCKRYDISVYDVTEELLGKFDIVFFFGVLYHLRHPLLALDKVSALCNEEIFVESAILNDYSPYKGGLGHGYNESNQIVAEFYSGNQYGGNDTNWWVPTLHCMGHMVISSGFEKVDAWKLDDKPESIPYCRGFVHGIKSLKE